jgi:hypothetical protein
MGRSAQSLRTFALCFAALQSLAGGRLRAHELPEVLKMRFLAIGIAAITLSTGAWAHGNCARGNGQGRGAGQGQGQCQCQGQGECKGQHDPANCTNPNCPKKQGANTGTQQRNPNK